ncbi:tetratricopeptide repeat protein [Sneathiella limimaris]|uniref:tetratricopeptide repeat protein n=1 Tax=Sneathiella limimaris TaxID=1964213 RepID=UPI00146F72A7|nr:hypothetical protein [Sneathiella limimaris]
MDGNEQALIQHYLAAATAIVGMLLGSGLLICVCIVYVKKHLFGVGGSVMSVVGTILVGIGIWSTIEISIAPDGKIEATLNKKIASLQQEVQTANETNVNFRNQVINTISSVPNVSQNNIEKLKEQERVKTLIDNKQYLEAIEIDPDNVIAIMRYIEEQLRIGKYREAIRYKDQLKVANRSGVGYSVYADLALAFDQLEESPIAIDLLKELEGKVSSDIQQGHGYLSRSDQMEWIRNDLARVKPQIKDQKVKATITDLDNKLANWIKKHTETSCPSLLHDFLSV